MNADDLELERHRRGVLDTIGAVVCLVVAVVLLPIGGYLLVTGRFAGWTVFALVGALVLTARLLTLPPEADQ